MATAKKTLCLIVCYLLASYVSELVFFSMLKSDDPLYGVGVDASPKWSLYWVSPLIIPFRYLLVGYSTLAGGRESFSQKLFAIPLATFVVTLLSSLSACYLITRHRSNC